MKTEQIILALNIARERSISKAADNLFISQPAASNMLKSLEVELGYPLFERSRAGIRMTDAGTEFIKHAATIERSLQAISAIRQPVNRTMFTVYSCKIGITERAFERMCKKYLPKSTIGFSYRVISTIQEAFRSVESGRGDIAIVACRQGIYDAISFQAQRKNMELIEICTSHIEVTCKKGHPILRDKNRIVSMIGDYPCFASVAESPEMYVPDELFRNKDRIQSYITMDPCDVRCRLLCETNGFLVSLPIDDEMKKKYELESFPVENSDMKLFALYEREPVKEELIREYIRYCQKTP